jgi:hypothetical protein
VHLYSLFFGYCITFYSQVLRPCYLLALEGLGITYLGVLLPLNYQSIPSHIILQTVHTPNGLESLLKASAIAVVAFGTFSRFYILRGVRTQVYCYRTDDLHTGCF